MTVSNKTSMDVWLIEIVPPLVLFTLSAVMYTYTLPVEESRNHPKSESEANNDRSVLATNNNNNNNNDTSHTVHEVIDSNSLPLEDTTTTTTNNNNSNGRFSLVRYLSTNHSNDWLEYSHNDELFVQQLPKIELHVHFDGAFDPDYLWNNCIIIKDNNNDNDTNETSSEDEPNNNNKQQQRTIFNQDVINRLPESFYPPWGGLPLNLRKDVSNCQSAREYHQLCTCRGQRSLSYMLNCFQYFLPIVQCQLQLLEQLAYDFVQRQYEQNVIYTEVRYSPHLFAEGFNSSTNTETADTNNTNETKKVDTIVTPEMVIDAITSGLRRGIDAYKDKQIIIINQILCAITWRPEWANEVVDLALKYRNNYPCAVVGIDVAAGEEHFDSVQFPSLYQSHYDMCQKAKEHGIPLTIHAGETSSKVDDKEKDNNENGDSNNNNNDNDPTRSTTLTTNVRRAIEEYGAIRIGHGYRSVHDVELMEYIQQRNIHLEICPTSSDETGGWDFDEDQKNWKHHPAVLMYNKYNIRNISLNSDDPAVFHTSLAWQYRIAITKMGFSKADLIHMNIQSINAAFGLSPTEKHTLRQIVECFAMEHSIELLPTDQIRGTDGTGTIVGENQEQGFTSHSDSEVRTSNQDDQIEFSPRSSSFYKKAISIDSFFCDRVYTNGIKM